MTHPDSSPTLDPADSPLPPVRIVRNWQWVPVPGEPMRFGGTPQLQLQALDTLEALVDGRWVPVPIIEMPAPEHPAVLERQGQQALRGELRSTQLVNLAGAGC